LRCATGAGLSTSEVSQTDGGMSTLLLQYTGTALRKVQVQSLVPQRIVKVAKFTVTLADTAVCNSHAKLIIQCLANCQLLLVLSNGIFKTS